MRTREIAQTPTWSLHCERLNPSRGEICHRAGHLRCFPRYVESGSDGSIPRQHRQRPGSCRRRDSNAWQNGDGSFGPAPVKSVRPLPACVVCMVIGCGTQDRPAQRCPDPDRTAWQERIGRHVNQPSSRALRGRGRQVRLEGGEGRLESGLLQRIWRREGDCRVHPCTRPLRASRCEASLRLSGSARADPSNPGGGCSSAVSPPAK